jgi:hypothetical protein
LLVGIVYKAENMIQWHTLIHKKIKNTMLFKVENGT